MRSTSFSLYLLLLFFFKLFSRVSNFLFFHFFWWCGTTFPPPPVFFFCPHSFLGIRSDGGCGRDPGGQLWSSLSTQEAGLERRLGGERRVLLELRSTFATRTHSGWKVSANRYYLLTSFLISPFKINWTNWFFEKDTITCIENSHFYYYYYSYFSYWKCSLETLEWSCTRNTMQWNGP